MCPLVYKTSIIDSVTLLWLCKCCVVAHQKSYLRLLIIKLTKTIHTLVRPGLYDVLTDMNPIFKGVIDCFYLNNKEGFIQLLEAVFTANEFE